MTVGSAPERRRRSGARLALLGGLAATVLTFGLPAPAQNVPLPGRLVRYSGSDPDGRLFYYIEAPAAENVSATFKCRDRLWLEIELYVEYEEMVGWLRAAGGEPLWAELVLDGVARRLFVRSFSYAPLTGQWIVPLDWSVAARVGEMLGRDTMAAFGFVSSIAIRTPAFTEILSPAEGDADARPRFVRSCIGYPYR